MWFRTSQLLTYRVCNFALHTAFLYIRVITHYNTKEKLRKTFSRDIDSSRKLYDL